MWPTICCAGTCRSPPPGTRHGTGVSKNATASAGTRSTTVRQTHHLLSWSGCRQQGLLLTSCKQQRATCVACSHSVVRRRCQRLLASRKDAPHRPSNPTQLVNAHVAAAGSPVLIAGLLILRPPCANSMRCLRCVHARALVLLVLGMDHGCTVCGVVCPAHTQTLLPVALAWEDPGGLSHAAFARTSHPR